MLDLQKEYARKLLTHRNAYTGRTYAEDPAVAFVEINNENGLIHAWLGKQVDELPEIFRAELGRQWNQWLRQRHGTTEKLRQAWTEGERPPVRRPCPTGLHPATGRVDPGAQGGAEATAAIVDVCPMRLRGAKSVQIAVTKPGTQDWHVRFQQAGMRVEVERSCTLSFWAKADRTLTISVSIDQTQEPWHVLGGRAPVSLTTQWQQYHVVLPINETDDKAALVFDPPMQAGLAWLPGFRCDAGGALGLGGR